MHSAKEKKPIPPLKAMIKGGRVRFDVPAQLSLPPMLGQHVHVVLNAPAKKLFAVLEDKHQVVLVDLANLQNELDGMKPPGAVHEAKKQAPPKVTRTGHRDTVAGRSCEDWDIETQEGERARMCVAEESVTWFALPDLALPPEHAWAGQLLDGKHLALRVIGYDKRGTEEGRIEVTKLEKKSIDDAQLEVPKDYAVTDVATMMKTALADMFSASGAATPAAAPAGAVPGLPPGVQLTPQMAEMIKKMQERAKAQHGAK